MADARDPEEVFYGDLLPYFDQIRGDQPNPTQRITKGQPICIRLRRKKKLLKPKPYSSPKRPRKKEIKNTGTPKGLKIFDPSTHYFQGQEMIENGRRTVKFFSFTKLDKPIVEKAHARPEETDDSPSPKKILLFEPLRKWYVEHGLKMTKIHRSIDCIPKQIFTCIGFFIF